MNRLTTLFQKKPNNILNIYFTAGYPNLGDTAPIIDALTNEGVDLIEIGMPYSDPLADGTTIQQSSQIALTNGMTLNLLFEQIATARAKNRTIPLVLMGYFNQVMQYGERRFLEKCQQAGVDGLILPDLPLDVYESHFEELLKEYDLKISFLITPQTPTERIKKIDDLTTGFVYVVSSYAITGSQVGISAEQIAYFERIEGMGLKNPRLIGFGISDKTTFQIATNHAQGAIIGSAYIRALGQNANVVETTKEFVGNLF